MTPWDSLEAGDWVGAWNAANQIDASMQKAAMAMVLVQWWASPLDAVDVAKSVQQSPLMLCANAYVELLQGRGDIVPRVITELQSISLTDVPAWIRHWLMVEHAGRSRAFEQQALLVRKILEKPAGRSLSWLYLSCLLNLDQKDADVAPLKRVLRNSRTSNPYALLLGVEILDESSKQVEGLERLSQRYEKEYWINIRYSQILAALGDVDGALGQLDHLASHGTLDGRAAHRWLMLSLSHPAWVNTLPQRYARAWALSPVTPRCKGGIDAYALIYAWLSANSEMAHSIYSNSSKYSNINLTKDEEKNRIFHNYILDLFIFKQKNMNIYNGSGSVLYFIGESHALSPHGSTVIFNKNADLARACFVMGVKMFHLRRGGRNVFKSCILAHIKNIPDKSPVVFTIGEIDCRPNEGIWQHSHKSGQSLEEVAKSTVSEYVEFLREALVHHNPALITLQGVPAPMGALAELKTADEREKFLQMICWVNTCLKREALLAGWSFLDVYSATVGTDGRSTGEWHLDSHHLKPSFYQQAHRWLITAISESV